MTPPLARHLAPLSIRSLRVAAEQRHRDALQLLARAGAKPDRKHRWAAVYLWGYTAEMMLGAAAFKAMGFSLTEKIDDDTRRLKMSQARKTTFADGAPLMGNEPHPIVGWARYFVHLRSTSNPIRGVDAANLLSRVDVVWRHWRPDLRYHAADVADRQLSEVRDAVEWLLENVNRI